MHITFTAYVGFTKPALVAGRDRIVVSTLRCGRSQPGLNPGHGTAMYFQKGCFLKRLRLTLKAKKLSNSAF